MAELKPCPNCNNNGAWLCRSQLGESALKPKYFFECKSCHWCSKKAFTSRGALRKWNWRVKDES